MKNTVTLLAFAILAFQTAFAEGINFEKGTWKEVVAKAKKENKLIYMDIYAEWCNPCKTMATKIFPLASVGNEYNQSFINFKIDAEKGEGIKLARQYNVTAYPTNIFIDPKDESVVYKVLGACDESDFLNRAKMALAMQKDPMKWSDYEAQLPNKTKDKVFVLAYIQKAKMVEQNNDKGIDAFVTNFVGENPSDSLLSFVAINTHTIDNKGFELLTANKRFFTDNVPGQADPYQTWVEELYEGTIIKAVTTKNVKLLDKINEINKKTSPKQAALIHFNNLQKYYAFIDDSVNLKKTRLAEIDYLMQKPIATYNLEDKESLEEIITSYKAQLSAYGMSPEEQEQQIKDALAANPSANKPTSSMAANILNSAAWEIAEKGNKATKSELKNALAWSKKTLELSENVATMWGICADTYAHLLYFNGEKDEAVKIQTKVIEILKNSELEIDLDDLENTRNKMKNGTL